MRSSVYIRFEFGQEDRQSRVFGPYDFVQLTYLWLRVGPDGDYLAQYDSKIGMWYIDGEPDPYSDVIVWGEEGW